MKGYTAQPQHPRRGRQAPQEDHWWHVFLLHHRVTWEHTVVGQCALISKQSMDVQKALLHALASHHKHTRTVFALFASMLRAANTTRTHLRCCFRRVGRCARILKSCTRNPLAVDRAKTMANACMSSSTHGCHTCSGRSSQKDSTRSLVSSLHKRRARDPSARSTQPERNKRTHPKWQRRARSGHGHGAQYRCGHDPALKL
jgi:hypothetical protein